MANRDNFYVNWEVENCHKEAICAVRLQSGHKVAAVYGQHLRSNMPAPAAFGVLVRVGLAVVVVSISAHSSRLAREARATTYINNRYKTRSKRSEQSPAANSGTLRWPTAGKGGRAWESSAAAADSARAEALLHLAGIHRVNATLSLCTNAKTLANRPKQTLQKQTLKQFNSFLISVSTEAEKYECTGPTGRGESADEATLPPPTKLNW